MGMLLGGDTLANLLGWAMATLGILAVYTYAIRYLNPRAARWAAALLSIMPAYLLLQFRRIYRCGPDACFHF